MSDHLGPREHGPVPIDIGSLIWGLLFASVSAVGVLTLVTGAAPSWALLSLGGPLLLIALGVLGLVLSRTTRPRRRRP